MGHNKFKILSIDGGGVRGIFPAMFLAKIEADLKSSGNEKYRIYEHFDLICGTSTGGIIALALALGISPLKIYNLYLNNSKSIFGFKKNFIGRIFKSSHSRNNLEQLIRKEFKDSDGNDLRLNNCKTNICIPIYDLLQGKPSVLKNKYHDNFVRDYHIPAYQAALATTAAPTFFDPYSANYIDLNGILHHFNNKIDGGIYANNPTLLGIVEAQKAFSMRLNDLQILSIGTGSMTFADAGERKNWGIYYWMHGRKRIIELFMQGQSQQVQNLISILKNGVSKSELDNFSYIRIDTNLDETCNVELDDFDLTKLSKLSEKAQIAYQNSESIIKDTFFIDKK